MSNNVWVTREKEDILTTPTITTESNKRENLKMKKIYPPTTTAENVSSVPQVETKTRDSIGNIRKRHKFSVSQGQPVTANIETVGNITKHYFLETKKESSSAKKEELNEDGFCVGPISSPPESTVDSIFNCGSPSGLCHYYYPAKFFSSCGVGQKYEQYVIDVESKRLNLTLWNNMPSIGFPTLSMHNQNISMIHVHKSGGTSLHTAFNKYRANHSVPLTRHHWFFPSKINREPIKRGKANQQPYFNFALWTAMQAVRYPSTFGPHDHVMFAVIRDPAERFISSVGQAMGASGSNSNGIAESFREECIKNTTKETLRCCIDYVKNHTFWVELHFTPQSLEVSFATLYQDIPVAIFDFKDLPLILDDLGIDPTLKMRNGKKKGYRKNEILEKLSVNDYDDDMLRDLCEIYKVDLLMRRLAGITNSRCDKVMKY